MLTVSHTNQYYECNFNHIQEDDGDPDFLDWTNFQSTTNAF